MGEPYFQKRIFPGRNPVMIIVNIIIIIIKIVIIIIIIKSNNILISIKRGA